MRIRKKGLYLAAGLIAGAVALTGCSAQTAPVVTPTPDTAAKATAQPITAAPDTQAMTPEPSASAAGEETPGPIALRVNGEELRVHALKEEDKLLLPLIETAEVRGWVVEEETVEEDEQTRRSVVLSREESRISVAWIVSDNTARRITWQKDGLLIPVDPQITTLEGVVYVPAAFFEEAMQARIAQGSDSIELSESAPRSTPETQEQTE